MDDKDMIQTVQLWLTQNGRRIGEEPLFETEINVSRNEGITWTTLTRYEER